MPTTSIIARTDIPGVVPNVSNTSNAYYIQPGELFINVADEILYSSNGTDYFQISGSGELANSEFIHNTFNGNGTNTQFTLSGSVSNTSAAYVYLNGVAQVPTTDYSISGSTLTFVTPPPSTDIIHTIILKGVGNYFQTTFIGNGTNTQFTLSSNTTASRTFVFINGVTQVPTADYYISGTTLIFFNAPALNDKVVVRGYSNSLEAAGTNTSVQFNDSGISGGSPGFTFNKDSNNVTIGNTLIVPNFILNASNPPASPTAAGSTGTFAWDSNYLYIATATNTWKKTPITTDGSGGGGGSPGGSNTQIQYNDSNTFNGSAAFIFNNTTNTVTLSNTLAIGSNLTINTSTIFIGNSTVNTTIIAGNVDLQGTQLRVGNVVINGNQFALGAVVITNSQITVGNSTVNTVIDSTGTIAGNGSLLTSVNAATVGGNTASDLRSYSESVGATAFSNAAARADSAYTNAASYADTKAAAAYSNAISYSGNAAQAYTNAVEYAASNTYVNNTFLPLAGGTLTGNLIINAAANVVSNLAANNLTIRGDVQIDGNLTVSGVSVTLNVASLAVEDNMIYLNNGSQVTNPDLGIAGNYNDGSYKHAGFFRDATDGIWKVFDGYTPEPDASAFIDTSNASFRIADFQANAISAASLSGNGASVTSVNAAAVGGNTASTLRSYSETVAATAFSNAAARADSAYSNAIAYSANATNISSGTVAFARLPALYLGTTQIQSSSAAQAVSGITTLAAGNTTITGLANVSSTMQITGDVGIGTTPTQYNAKVVVQNSGNTSIMLWNSGIGSGHLGFSTSSSNFKLYNTYTDGLLANGKGIDIVANGHVGIANTAPSAPLTVNGTSGDGTAVFRVNSTAAGSTFNWAASFMNSSLGSSRNTIVLIGQAESDKNSGYIGFNHSGTSGSNSNFLSFGLYSVDNILNITGNGNVGIGTTSPTTKLHVVGSAIKVFNNATFARLDVGSTNNNYYLQVEDGTFDGIGFYQAAPAPQGWRFVVNTDGNVGIGTTSPGAKLDVQGGRTYLAASSEAFAAYLRYNTTTAGVFIGSPSADAFQVSKSSGAALFNIASSGDIGMGSAVGDNTLRYFDVYNTNTGSSAGSIIRLITSNTAGTGLTTLDIVKYKTGGVIINNNETDSGAFISLNVAGGERLRIDVAGRTMIGTTTANTTANTVFTVKGFTSNTSNFMTEFRGGDGTLRSAITDRGAQNWYIQAGDGLEKGSLRYSTPNGFVGILFFNNAGADRSDIRHVSGGGFTFHGHSLSSAPSTELLKIQPLGITMGAQPAFIAYSTGNQEPTSLTTISYAGIELNRGSHYNTSTSRFTAPVAGLYTFMCRTWMSAGTTGTIYTYLYKNGGVYAETRLSDSSGLPDYHTHIPKWNVYLNAGDYVEIVGNGTGTSVYHTSNSIRYSEFSGYLVG